MSGGAFNTFVYNRRVYNARIVVEPVVEPTPAQEQKKAAGSGTYIMPEPEKGKQPQWFRDEEEFLAVLS